MPRIGGDDHPDQCNGSGVRSGRREVSSSILENSCPYVTSFVMQLGLDLRWCPCYKRCGVAAKCGHVCFAHPGGIASTEKGLHLGEDPCTAIYSIVLKGCGL